jgi:hypothetical protein
MVEFSYCIKLAIQRTGMVSLNARGGTTIKNVPDLWINAYSRDGEEKGDQILK